MICRGDAARRRQGRPVPPAVRRALRSRRAGVRDRRLDGTRLARRGDQLPGDQRSDRVHHARADDRHHRPPSPTASPPSPSSSGAGAITSAATRPGWPSTWPSPSWRWSSRSRSSTTRATPVTPGTSCGAVPDGRRRLAHRHPGLPRDARLHDRSPTCPRPLPSSRLPTDDHARRLRHRRLHREDPHAVPCRLRGRPAQAGDRAPTRSRAQPADPGQRRRAAVRRRDVGRARPRGARRVRRPARGARGRRPPLRDPARRGAGRARRPGVLAGAAHHCHPLRTRPGRAARRAGRVHAGGHARRAADRWGAEEGRRVAAADAEPADGLPGAPTTSCSSLCRTTSSSATTPPGSTTGCRSTRWPSRPGSGRRSTRGWSTTSTRCSATCR